MNPIEMFKVLLGKQTPQQAIVNIMGNNNPMINNMLEMAKNGDKNGVENIARNLCKEKGIDFDKEFDTFMKQMK